MKDKRSKDLVIDASVARASGEGLANHPSAATTRDFLQAVLKICHKAVMTQAVREEWDRHQSNFARKWRSSMVARKKLRLLVIPERENLRNKLQSENIPPTKRNAMLKDFHLIEAALKTDQRIITLDDAARTLFCETSSNISELRNILWVNPVSDPVEVMEWLRKGAHKEKRWKLEPA